MVLSFENYISFRVEYLRWHFHKRKNIGMKEIEERLVWKKVNMEIENRAQRTFYTLLYKKYPTAIHLHLS